MIKRTVFISLILMLMFSTALSAESVDYEGITARFIKAFREGAPFSEIRRYFFTVDDLEPFLRQMKNSIPDSTVGKAVQKLLDQMEDPAKRVILEKKINLDLEKAQKVWEKILKYPADPGTRLKIKRLRITINYNPLKYYSIKVYGKYTRNGTRSSFSMRADFVVLNGRVRIMKFRS